ncbi:MAG: tetratricopeptide repeat protein [Sulfuricurvum sp.]|uniref:tetratricopeptide repeat protein n=1 Tax=Sulfuricurvum sp. TaxID=2025608 RepID=UPI002610145B|nr:tetratricopeptide repeat protein [Sulfuricurvum sp.]MDD5160365.1 tetratricopeptide repeat protein [Sulfuricurvum sp.]
MFIQKLFFLVSFLFIFSSSLYADECTSLDNQARDAHNSKNVTLELKLLNDMCEKSCYSGFGCSGLIKAYREGTIVKKNIKKADEITFKSCDEYHNSFDCFQISLNYQKLNNIPKYIEYADKSCQAGILPSCFDLGIHFFKGDIIKTDYVKSKYYFLKITSAPKVGVEMLSNAQASIANMYENGLGIRQDYFESMQYNKLACDNDNSTACMKLASQYYQGKGAHQDIPLAKESFGKACDLGIQRGCDFYKELDK